MVKDAVPLGECRRALVLELRRRGEALLAGPVLSVLKARGVEVDALAYADAAPLLEGHAALSRLHRAEREWRTFAELALFRALRARGYDLVVHLSDEARGAWLARLLGARYSVAPDAAGRGRLWKRSFTHLYTVAARRDATELGLDALRRIGVQPGAGEWRPAAVGYRVIRGGEA